MSKSSVSCATLAFSPGMSLLKLHMHLGLDSNTLRPYQAILSLETSILPPILYGHHMSVSSPTPHAHTARSDLSSRVAQYIPLSPRLGCTRFSYLLDTF
eukprot:2131657-Pyramimonas_sp.AAC.2